MSIYQLGDRLLSAAEDDRQHQPADACVCLPGQRGGAVRGGSSRLQQTRLLTVTGRVVPARRGSRSSWRGGHARSASPTTKTASSAASSPRSETPALVLGTIAQTLTVREQPDRRPSRPSPRTSGKAACCSCSTTSSTCWRRRPSSLSSSSACPGLTLLCHQPRAAARHRRASRTPCPRWQRPRASRSSASARRLEPSDGIAELCSRLEGLPLADRAGGRPDARPHAGAAARAALPAPRSAQGRPRRGSAPADPQSDDRVVVRAALRRRSSSSSPASPCSQAAARSKRPRRSATPTSTRCSRSSTRASLRFTDGRYWMLETIREYAGERLAKSGEAEKLAAAARCGTSSSSRRRRSLSSGHSTPTCGSRGSTPRKRTSELRSARPIRREEAEVASGLPVRSIRSGKSVRGTAKRVRWLDRALALDGAVPPSCRAKALVAAGRATSWQSDWPTAIPVLEEAAELSRKLDDVEGVGRCLGFIGHARLYHG